MKKFIIFLLIALSFNSCSNDKQKQESIKFDFEAYFNAIKNKNIDQAVNSIYPRFFEIVPKDQMVKMLNSTYNNPQLGFEVDDFKIKNIKEVEELNNLFYSIIQYQFQLKLKLKSEDLQKSQSDLQKSMEDRFGSENVKYDDANNTFTVNSSKKAIGISENGVSGWKFVILEDEYKPYLTEIIPKKILDEN